MPLTGSGSSIGCFTKKEYEKSLKEVMMASQKASHLWSQAMGYISDSKLVLFSMHGADYVLMRDSEGRMGLHYELKKDSMRITTPRLNLGYLAGALENAYATGYTNVAPEDLAMNFCSGLEEPMEKYSAIEPSRAASLRRRLKRTFN